MTVNKIAVVGAGGVGGYFGTRLAAAGEDVYFLVRSHSLAAIRARGMTVVSESLPLRLPVVKVYDRAADIGPVDIIVFAVKLPDADNAARMIAPLIGPHTILVPFQNGVEGPPLFSGRIPLVQVAAGCAHIIAALQEPGTILQNGPLASLRFGPLSANQRPQLLRFEAACRKAGIDARLENNIWPVIWEKFIPLVAISGMTTISRKPIGLIRNDPALRERLRALMQEAFDVSFAEGIGLTSDFVERKLHDVDRLPDNMKSSMLLDLEAGRRLELPWLSGAVVRLGERYGIATPANQRIITDLASFRPVQAPFD